ncbi:MAG: alanine dehydrogenase [Rhodocyclales bacterium GWA2_65_19]|nr:MAG: alanine dehydrogenase [Rhodocyclales bacterium GWA2_65_19]
MLVGIPKEIKNNEYRVGMTPGCVREFVKHGHKVLVQSNAGHAIGLADEQYRAAGAELVDDADEIFGRAGLIVKIKEPQPDECRMLRRGQLLFTYLHLAPDPVQAALLVASGAIAMAYETVTDASGSLPLLAPMSAVAGRMSIQAGATCLQKSNGGCGLLLAGVPGVPPAKVVVLGGGVVGSNAALMAVGMGAQVAVLDRSQERLMQLDAVFGNRIRTIFATDAAIEEWALDADLVVGAVLIPGAAAPKLITREMLRRMRPGSVLVDVSIDQGGCFETSRPTTHASPTFIDEGIVHYCVANMPGAVARTSTFALNHATLPYALRLADNWRTALAEDRHFRNGVNVFQGAITCAPVAAALGYDYVDPERLVAASA